MKSTLNIGKILIIVYTALLAISLLKEIACLCYYSFAYDKKMWDLLPEKVVVPQYDLETGEVANANEVTVWDYTDFIPKNRYRVYEYFSGIAWSSLIESLFLIVLFIPMIICYVRTKTKPYLAIALLAACFIIARFVLSRYW